jgi:hypothetical protein
VYLLSKVLNSGDCNPFFLEQEMKSTGKNNIQIIYLVFILLTI